MLSKVARCSLLVLFLVPGLLVAATKEKAPLMLQAINGPRPPLRAPSRGEKQGFRQLVDKGWLKEIPEKVRDERTVSIKVLTVAERDALIAEIGQPLEKLPNPTGARVKSPPKIPR